MRVREELDQDAGNGNDAADDDRSSPPSSALFSIRMLEDTGERSP